jgi:DNA-binding transcriptional ArsR family regulator
VTELHEIARLLGDPTRAEIVDALMAGTPQTVTALARAANVSVASASEALAALRAAGLVCARRDGRRHLHELASTEVAEAVEALGRLAPRPNPSTLRAAIRDEAFRHARSCYDHLAGRVGVALLDAMLDGDVLRWKDGELAVSARVSVLEELGVDVDAARARRRPLVRACCDWTERRPHLAGGLGSALLQALLEQGILARRPGGRALRVTELGERRLASVVALRRAA